MYHGKRSMKNNSSKKSYPIANKDTMHKYSGEIQWKK